MINSRSKNLYDQFRSDICQKQRQQIICRLRNAHLSTNRHPINAPNPIFQSKQNANEPYLQYLTQIKNQKDIVTNLTKLEQLLNESSDYYRIIMNLVDHSIHLVLTEQLKESSKTMDTTLSIFSLISSILSKQKLKVGHKFVNQGLIEYVLHYCQFDEAYIPLGMNILGNLIFENIQNAQILLENNSHRVLSNLIRNSVLNQCYCTSKLTEKAQRIATTVVWVLAGLVQVETAEHYKPQFLEVLSISLEMSKYHILPKLVLEIIFLVGFFFPQQTKYEVRQFLNQLLLSMSPESNFIKQFLIVVKILTPLQIDYQKLAYLTQHHREYISYSLRILEKVLEHNAKNDIDANPLPLHDEIWWLKIYEYCQKVDDKQAYTKLLRYSRLQKQWIFPIVNQLLHSASHSLTLTNQLLTYLIEIAGQDFGIIDEKQQNARHFMKIYNIDAKLETLYEKSRNQRVLLKCETLLSLINRRSSSANLQ